MVLAENRSRRFDRKNEQRPDNRRFPVDAAMLADEHDLRYRGAFTEVLYNEQEMEAHRDESYEDILRAEGEID